MVLGTEGSGGALSVCATIPATRIGESAPVAEVIAGIERKIGRTAAVIAAAK